MKNAIIVFLLLLTNLMFAQNYRYTLYNTENSDLPQNQIMSLFQDSKGNIWIGTKFGAAKFDGESFKIFSSKKGVLSGDISQIFETSKGEIFLCSNYGGISVIIGDSVKTIQKPDDYEVFYYCQKKDSLIIVANYKNEKEKSALLSFYNGKLKSLNKMNGIFYIAQYANDTIWSRLLITDNQTNIGYFDEHYIFHTITNDFITACINFGDTLFLSGTLGLFKYYSGNLSRIMECNEFFVYKLSIKGIYIQEFSKKRDYKGI